ncbi:hypothetical protein GA0070610_2897 [Micromonospora echinofusca]|uniref:Uncharacterized protein n=1 Tax=Micromonospora echinofusca TaxID=47858 RepID=A0A1C5G9P2_MICEH|nr:hypothetical protein [Micromonospora echinofusca]SCG16625.1 hypothetical protein GA0070610_2897 [Micromonospora echinofusca]
MAHGSYTADGSYWTVRKHGSTFWVVRIRNENGTYRRLQWWGGYRHAGHAARAAAQLAYRQAREDVVKELRGSLHRELERVGLGALPTPAPLRPDASVLPPDEETSDAED